MATRSPSDRSPQRIVVVANPTKIVDLAARRTWAERAASAVGIDDLGWMETTADDVGTGQARAAAEAGATTVISWGGDGTARAVAAGLVDTDTALAIMPAGTGNLLARNLGLPLDLQGALAVAFGDGERRIDVLEVGLGGSVTLGLVIAGLGLDAELMDASEGAKSRVGPVAYALGMAPALRKGHLRAGISIDGGPPHWVTARTVMVANVGGLFAGLDIAPEAILDDGELDVVVLPLRSARDWVVAIGSMVRKRGRSDQYRQHFRGRQVRIVTRQPETRQVDGDLVGVGTRLEVRVKPLALAVKVP